MWSYSPNMLLTGAGFSKSFGGYLGAEMWAVIYNQPEIIETAVLRSAMRDSLTLNYEEIYSLVTDTSNNFSEDQKRKFSLAIRRAYWQMQREINSLGQRSLVPVSGLFREVIARFNDSEKGPTLFFTLNQDLMAERFGGDYMRIPFLHCENWFNRQLQDVPLDYSIRLPTQQDIDTNQNSFTGTMFYLKLHGSFGWVSSDGSDRIVIGTTKAGIIQQEPLLKWQFGVFETALQRPANLLVIGYSFSDEHINRAIVDGLHKGLQLFVISVMSPLDFRNKLAGKNPAPHGRELWEGLSGYYPESIAKLFYDSSDPQRPMFAHLLGRLGLSNT